MGSGRSPKRRVRDDDFIVGYRRIIVGLSSDILESSFYWRKQFRDFPLTCWPQNSWQAHYLVRLEGDFACSAHWKWRFICVTDHWWHWFCVAGAAFGEVGCWLYLLRALEMTFHMWHRSLMTFILRGRRRIWWSSSRTFRGRRSTSWHFGR